MIEEWRQIEWHEGCYDISNLGNVRSLPRVSSTGRLSTAKVKILKASIGNQGYPVVNLSRKGRVVQRTVHSLVAGAFLGDPPPGEEVRHGDGNRANPRLDNLSYGTRRENVEDAQAHGTHVQGETVGNSKLKEGQVLEIKRRVAAEGPVALGREFGVSYVTIINIRDRRNWAWLKETT